MKRLVASAAFALTFTLTSGVALAQLAPRPAAPPPQNGPLPPPPNLQPPPPQVQPPPNNPPPILQPPAQPPPTNSLPVAGPPPLGSGGAAGSRPLARLGTNELALFKSGADQFDEVETIEKGLGPAFNNVSCVACHFVPARGGSSTNMVTRFGRMTNGAFDPMTELGGSLLQSMAIDPAVQEVVPAEATIIAHRKTTSLLGAGLIEAIPDNVILRNAARPKPDGVKGRAAIVYDIATQTNRVGRYGWKNQQATLLSFAGDAYVNEMGITSRLFPTENAPNGNTYLLQQFDMVTDPEDHVDSTGMADIDRLATFMRFLAPPQPGPRTANARRGAGLFTAVGCAVCHQRTLVTGKSKVAALNLKPVELWSDLLLHDMGNLGDGIAQGAAGQREMRTSPLWGVRFNAPYLHDGRAPDLDAAIRAHDGEAAVSTQRYEKLNDSQRGALIEFLNSL
ncbi:MAG: di-heme oxidoredictase family protein [Limisphaerales bacterium]